MTSTLEPTDPSVDQSITTDEVMRRTGVMGRVGLVAAVAGVALAVVVGAAAVARPGGQPIADADDQADASHHAQPSGQTHADDLAHVDGYADHSASSTASVEPPLPVAQPAPGFDPSVEVANYDGSVVASIVRAAAATDGDRLVYTFAAGSDGSEPVDQHWADLPPGFELRALSADGTKAALMGTTADGSGTEILIADRAAERASRLLTTHRFDGLVEPEAFATDGQALFVIDHQAGSEPGTYRVRPLNLETGQLEEMLGPSKVPLIEDMNGVGRRQIWGVDDNRLYTLYIRQTDHVHASGRLGSAGFVHILDLAEEWAFCLDLPESFGQGELATTALAVGPDTLAVLDLSAGEFGQIAFASIADRRVTSVVDVPLSFLQTQKAMFIAAAKTSNRIPGTDTMHLAMSGDMVALGIGDAVAWFDAATLELVPTRPNTTYSDRHKIPGPLMGLTAMPDGRVMAWPQGGAGPVQLSPPMR